MCSATAALDGDTLVLVSWVVSIGWGPVECGSIASWGVRGIEDHSRGHSKAKVEVPKTRLEWRVSVRVPSDYGAVQLLLDSAAQEEKDPRPSGCC